MADTGSLALDDDWLTSLSSGQLCTLVLSDPLDAPLEGQDDPADDLLRAAPSLFSYSMARCSGWQATGQSLPDISVAIELGEFLASIGSQASKLAPKACFPNRAAAHPAGPPPQLHGPAAPES